ncbi:hypothetical protein GCM10011344_20300 [Dokdonia pacifica]|uniref:Uncharacterized protein n=3 Tax=Dokdonia pacifica TaxID=1627892 RepID=A0A238VQ07_9FLAO|nr:hypothetical protein GCM10011344_20300 [Dokdonia pacifica]SNR35863.1 hypothetical protein SAMN06265376_101103 [Dokdonia pacifica]
MVYNNVMRKRFYKFSLIILTVFFLTSCSVTEHIIFKSKENGLYEKNIDMSLLIKAMSKKQDLTANGAPVRLDTTIVFSDFYKQNPHLIVDMSSKEKEILESLAGYTIRSSYDLEKMTYDVVVSTHFSETETLNEIPKNIDKVLALLLASNGSSSTLESFYNVFEGGVYDIVYEVRENSFKRTFKNLKEDKKEIHDSNEEIVIIESDEIITEEGAEGENQSDDDGLTIIAVDENGNTESWETKEKKSTSSNFKYANELERSIFEPYEEELKKSSLTIKYTFPKKITETSVKDVKISDDKKTVLYTVLFDNLKTNINILENFEVVLEE